ncbi:LysE family translocator [Acuticoccus sp. MNP-M23]|uniref:LysE family translocator n=1 Tax=Acuticoccus sp. MNP-M23 TaxID=3072793 RepID=UPI002815C23D|nr:LysE family translocator [Acuticoccus sp. MNP-M23]WMS43198.1 LysE family translocator [Acuticoccus sp. MNP-M23]
MALDILLLFAATEFLLCISPGPSVLLVVGLAMRSGTRAGWAAAAGVTAGSAFYFALSALGVGGLIVASHTLFTIVKWAGAAYLVYLGIRMMGPLVCALRNGAMPAAGPLPVADGGGSQRAFWKGFAVQLANPKTLIFFVALFPQFIAPEGNVALQFAVMALVSALIEMPVLMVYALVSAASARWMARTAVLWFEGLAGAVLVFIGGALALARGR